MPAGLKEDVLRLVSSLPDNMSWDDLLLAIHERMLVEQALADVASGRTYSTEEVRKRCVIEA
jgi:hypothetical protein